MKTTILLPPNLKCCLTQALQEAGAREIGGILMGEQIKPGSFRITDLTIQRRGGTIATFVRRIGDALHALSRFFDRTEHVYTRFNYLGEWHSHPSFASVPSPRDTAAMRRLVGDPAVGATFAILLIVKREVDGTLDATVNIFLPDGTEEEANLIFEASDD